MVEGQHAVAAKGRDLVDQRLAQAGNVGQLAAIDQHAEVFRHVLEGARTGGIGPDLERVLSRQFHEGRNLVEDGRDITLFHHGCCRFSER